MTDEQLQRWVEYISLRDFGRPFEHRATFNRRLRATGGRYFLKTHHIEFPWAHYQAYGKEEVEKIIKHELCHYHLHRQGRGFRHRDPEFQALLQKTGGSRYCRPLTRTGRRPEPIRYLLRCRQCEAVYYRKRKVTHPDMYAAGAGGSWNRRESKHRQNRKRILPTQVLDNPQYF